MGHGSTCSRVRVLNQQWRPVEDPSSEVSHDNGQLRSSRPEEIRLVREQRLLSKHNMNHPTWEWSHSRCSEHTARQNACSGQSTFTGLRGHKHHKIFCATLRMAKSAGHDEARSPAHFKCFEIMPAIFSMSTLRATCLCPRPLASSILHTQYSVFSTRENEDCPPNLHLQHRVGARPIVINASVKTTAQAQDDHRNKQNQVCFLHAPVS